MELSHMRVFLKAAQSMTNYSDVNIVQGPLSSNL